MSVNVSDLWKKVQIIVKINYFYSNNFIWKNIEKNQTCDVIKTREMREEVGKKPHKKEMENHSFLWRHIDDF